MPNDGHKHSADDAADEGASGAAVGSSGGAGAEAADEGVLPSAPTWKRRGKRAPKGRDDEYYDRRRHSDDRFHHLAVFKETRPPWRQGLMAWSPAAPVRQ